MNTLKLIFIAVLIAFGVRTCAFQPFRIPSESMEPTILVGDYLFASKFSYGYSRYSFPFAVPGFPERLFGNMPERGDVIIFRPVSDSGRDYVKRIIGMPGDVIQMKEGRLYINDLQAERTFNSTVKASYGHLVDIDFRIYTETLPDGFTHQIQEFSDTDRVDETEPFEVPGKHFFVMGDNRDRSSDSRLAVGLVPYENIVGQATRVFNSIDYEGEWYEFWKWPTNIRYSRLFRKIV